MSVVRPDKIPGVFASAGTTTIPPVPVTDTTYRDAALTEAAVENGWPYNKIVNSSEFNQTLYLYSSLLADIDAWGIAGWSDQVDYAQGAWVRGSDGASYRATATSGPSTTAQDPVTSANRPDFWQSFDEILKAVNLVWSDKVDYTHPTLAFGSDDQLYVSLQDSGPSGAGAQDPTSEPAYWAVFSSGGGAVTVWDSGTDYTNPVLVYGSDNRLYISQQDSGPGGVGAQDPISDDGTYWRVLDNSFGYQIMIVEEQQPSGTDAGTFTAGAYETRALNTVVKNDILGATLSSNQIILPAGTYFFTGSAPAIVDTVHKTRIQNVTDATTAIVGTSEESHRTNATATRSMVRGVVAISSAKTFELQHRTSVSGATDGLGRGAGFGEVEIFAELTIWKVL